MNKENYKEIALLIRHDIETHLPPVEKDYLKHLCTHLVDYFEKESPIKCFHGIKESGFTKKDREQFLKDCGVEQ